MQRDKIKKKIITFLISTVVIYFVFLLAYNLLTYASAFRNLNLGISINDFYKKRWALPASGLYYETEVLVITIALVVAFIYLALSFLSIISSIWYMTSDKTKDLRGSSAWASEEEIEENGYLFKWKDLKKKNGRKPSIILGQGLDVKVSGKSATKYRIQKNSQYLIGAELSKEKGKTPELAHTLIFGTTGCHAKGTPILMADGNVKNIEDIKIGDKVMGDDGTPRNVLRLYHGTDDMFKIFPKKSKPIICNGEHKLRLIFTVDKNKDLSNKEKGKKIRYRNYEEFIELTINDYLKKSNNFKHLYKLYYGKVNNFLNETKINDLKIPPYILGCLLGDGSISSHKSKNRTDTHKCCITCNDEIVLKEFENWIVSLGGFCRREKSGGGCHRYIATLGRKSWQHNERKWLTYLKEYNLLGCVSDTKFIPFQYKTAERKARLELLAGIIDTDGSLETNSYKNYEITTKSKQLANDIAFLARSLGFSVNSRIKKAKSQTGFIAYYHRITICGDINEIPCKIDRKICKKINTQNKRNNVCAFSIEALGKGEFFGIQVDANNLYMNDDFLVLRNSGKGVSTIIPTLLSHSGSLICYDPAGENFRETSDYRSNIGSVLYFNPQDMNSTLHFNPYDWIRRDSNFISTDIENMANIIIPTNPNAKDPFWDNMAKMLLNMYMSFTMLTANPDKCNMYQTTRILNTLFDEKDDEEVLIKTNSEDEIVSSKKSVEGNSSEAKEEKKKEKITFLAVLDKMEDILKRNLRCCWINEGSWEKTLATLTLDNISNFKMQVGSETTMGSIISVFNSHMSFYTNPNTAKLMDRTSFKPDDLLYNEKPLSIYLIILAEDNERCKTFVRVFCECVLSRLERDDARYKRDGRHTLLFLLDEFPLLGYMGTIEKAIPVTRKYGIAFCLITQDLAQLEKSYTKQGAVSLLNNMHIVNIKKSNDIDTANWISRSMGKQTLEISRTSFSKQRGSLMSNSSSTSTQSEGRDLLDASEVRRLENWKQIIFIQGTQPVLSAKIQWFGTEYFTKRRNEKWKEGSDTIDRGYGKRFEMSVEEEIVDEMDEIFAAIPCDVIADVKEEAKINNVGQTDFLESFELEKMQESKLPLKKENSMSDNHEKKEENNSFLQDVAMDEKSDKAYNCW